MNAPPNPRLKLTEQQALTASIQDIIARNPGITRAEIVERACVPSNMVRPCLGWLARNGKACFKGAEKRWYVIGGKRS